MIRIASSFDAFFQSRRRTPPKAHGVTQSVLPRRHYLAARICFSKSPRSTTLSILPWIWL